VSASCELSHYRAENTHQSAATEFHTHSRFRSPCLTVNRSYRIPHSFFAGSGPLAPHCYITPSQQSSFISKAELKRTQNQPPSASCSGLNNTGTPASCSFFNCTAMVSISCISSV
jgi:hypothetical protein